MLVTQSFLADLLLEPEFSFGVYSRKETEGLGTSDPQWEALSAEQRALPPHEQTHQLGRGSGWHRETWHFCSLLSHDIQALEPLHLDSIASLNV